MNYDEIKAILLSFKGSSLSFPFDDTTPVFKVRKKMFALVGNKNETFQLNLKCDPDDALILRSQFEAILPGYHMNKDHWNTVILDGSIPHDLLLKLIDDSYSLVVKTMSKKEQQGLGISS